MQDFSKEKLIFNTIIRYEKYPTYARNRDTLFCLFIGLFAVYFNRGLRVQPYR